MANAASVPPSPKRHFIFQFKEHVFEVLCEDLRMVGIFPDYASALHEANKTINPA
jgi:hypothetical protein